MNELIQFDLGCHMAGEMFVSGLLSVFRVRPNGKILEIFRREWN